MWRWRTLVQMTEETQSKNPYKTVVILMILTLIIFGVIVAISSINEKQRIENYQTGYSNCSNNTMLGLWNDINDDACVTIPYPINGTIEQLRFCYTK